MVYRMKGGDQSREGNRVEEPEREIGREYFGLPVHLLLYFPEVSSPSCLAVLIVL